MEKHVDVELLKRAYDDLGFPGVVSYLSFLEQIDEDDGAKVFFMTMKYELGRTISYTCPFRWFERFLSEAPRIKRNQRAHELFDHTFLRLGEAYRASQQSYLN